WLLVGAFGALGGIFFASAAHCELRGVDEPQQAIVRASFFPRPWILAAGFTVLALANVAIQPYGLKLSLVRERVEKVRDPDSLILWNSFSRVEVSGAGESTPEMWGPSRTMPATKILQRYTRIDGSAASPMYRFDGDLSKLEFLKYDITNLAYSIRHDGRAAVIGVGGGRDLLLAKNFGFPGVTGIELNPILVNLLTNNFRDYDPASALPHVLLYL